MALAAGWASRRSPGKQARELSDDEVLRVLNRESQNARRRRRRSTAPAAPNRPRPSWPRPTCCHLPAQPTDDTELTAIVDRAVATVTEQTGASPANDRWAR